MDRIGQRLRSRLTEMCLKIPVDGDDFRERRQMANRNVVLGTSGHPPDPAPTVPVHSATSPSLRRMREADALFG